LSVLLKPPRDRLPGSTPSWGCFFFAYIPRTRSSTFFPEENPAESLYRHAPAEADVGRRVFAKALVAAGVVVVLDKGRDLILEIAGRRSVRRMAGCYKGSPERPGLACLSAAEEVAVQDPAPGRMIEGGLPRLPIGQDAIWPNTPLRDQDAHLSMLKMG
jgi:hypothetical protein